ncbi:MAG: PQQ-binding-like beta-propeller repeat protein [Victivallaceae bacterium]|nr:PQQ-binding-like beta-propeller repeat protein [Victivallaceae bacterium]
MKKKLAIIFVFAAIGCMAPAREVSGTVKKNDGAPVPGALVTDGIAWTQTGSDGEFKIDVRNGQKFLILHEASEWRAISRYLPLTETAKYSFTVTSLQESGGGAPVRFLQVADTETSTFEFVPEVRRIADEYGADFVVNTGDLCRFPGIADHAEHFTAAALGREVFFTVGNHDIVATPEDGRNYQDYLGPYWYSFERGGVMFITMAMNYGDVALPYALEDYGDWLAGLLKLTGDKPYILLGHNLPGQQMPPVIPSHNGPVQLDNRLLGIFFGHWHLNMELGCAELKAKAYCVAPPNKAGIDHDPASVRLVTVSPGGISDASIVYPHSQVPYFEITGAPVTVDGVSYFCDPRGETSAVDSDGRVLWTVPPVRSGVPPSRTGCTFADGVLYAGFGLDLKAITPDGLVLWRNTEWNGSHSFMGRITVANGVVISGSQWQGIFANDAATGKLLWKSGIEDLRFTTATVTYADGSLWAKGFKKVYRIEPKTGEIQRIYDIGVEIQTATPVLVTTDMLIVGSARSGVYALDKFSGETKWHFDGMTAGMVSMAPYGGTVRGIEAPLALQDGELFIPALDGNIYVLDVKNGTMKEKISVGAPMLEAPTQIGKDRVTVATVNGQATVKRF